MVMDKKVFIIATIIFILLVLCLVLFMGKPEEIYKEKVNNELKEEQILTLIKYSTIDLIDYNNMGSNIITTDQMVKFSLSYIIVIEEDNVDYENGGDFAKVRKKLVEEKVEYLFGKQLDYSNLTYDTDNEYIYIPRNMTGGDAQIYKYRTKIYNEQEGTYTVYIDVLEAGPSRYSKLEKSDVTEYSKEDVLSTIVFKYKQEQDRKVLLSYNIEQNW